MGGGQRRAFNWLPERVPQHCRRPFFPGYPRLSSRSLFSYQPAATAELRRQASSPAFHPPAAGAGAVSQPGIDSENYRCEAKVTLPLDGTKLLIRDMVERVCANVNVRAVPGALRCAVAVLCCCKRMAVILLRLCGRQPFLGAPLDARGVCVCLQ